MPPRGWRKHDEEPEGPVSPPEPKKVKKPAIEPATACAHCGASPMQPTRDGRHKCQCRSEKVT